MNVKELFGSLGLEVDKASFRQADLLMRGVKAGLMAVAASAVAAGAGFIAAVRSTAQAGDEMMKTSQAVGVGIEALQELKHAASLGGVGFDELKVGLMRLSRSTADAADGQIETAQAFDKLGISVRDQNGELKNADVVMTEMADRFAAMPDGAQKTSLAMDLLGKSGAKMIPVLNAGSAGLAELRQEARDLGLVIDLETAKQSEEFNDTLERVTGALTGLRNELIGPLLKGFTGAAKGILEWIKHNRVLLKQRLERTIGAVTKAFKVMLVPVKILAKAVGFLIDNLETVAAILTGAVLAALYMQVSAAAAAAGGYVALGWSATVAGLKAAAAWVAAAAPVVLLAALFAVVLLVLEDIYVALQGGDSLIKRLWDQWSNFLDKWLTPKDDDPWWLVAVKGLIYFITNIGEAWDSAVEYWKSALNRFFDWIGERVSAMGRSIKNALKKSVDWIPGVDFEDEPALTSRDITNVLRGPAPSRTPVSGGKGAPTLNATINANGVTEKQAQEVAANIRDTLDAWWSGKAQEAAVGVSQ